MSFAACLRLHGIDRLRGNRITAKEPVNQYSWLKVCTNRETPSEWVSLRILWCRIKYLANANPFPFSWSVDFVQVRNINYLFTSLPCFVSWIGEVNCVLQLYWWENERRTVLLVVYHSWWKGIKYVETPLRWKASIFGDSLIPSGCGFVVFSWPPRFLFHHT